MGDLYDMDDIEDLLEAPYKKVEEVLSEIQAVTSHENMDEGTPTHTNGNNTDSALTNGNGNGQTENGHSQDDQKSKNDENSKISKKSRSNKDRSKSRDRERSRDRRHNKKQSSKSRDRSGSRSKKASKRDRGGSRDRSRDRPRRKSSRSAERDRNNRDRRASSRSRGGGGGAERRRSRSRGGSRTRDNNRRRERTPPKRRERTPELTPEERDVRTVFCMQLSNRIRPRDLEEFFIPCGKVRDVRLITDPRTKRSKGIAYIEFKDIPSVEKAIALTGQRLLGVPIICKLTQAEKNRMPLVIPNQTTPIIPLTGSMKLYIGSLHVNINEEMLKGIFEPFGNIDVIVLSKDDFGRSKGYGFIQFSHADDAKKAMEQLNNFELANRPIKVAPFIEKPTDPGHFANLDNEELDKAGVNLGPSGKLALMAKLAEGSGIKIPQQTLDAITASENAAQAEKNYATEQSERQYEQHTLEQQNYQEPEPTQCFLLSNMFDLAEEQTKPNWVEEISDDVIEECKKYGGTVHINIDQVSTQGNISIKCQNISVACAAMAGMSGRYFAGKLIRANFIPVVAYHQKFPEAVYSTKNLEPTS